MFIQTVAMPDPAALKFLPGRPVLAQGTLALHDRARAVESPLAQRLFAVPGVAGVILGTDSIVILKDGGDWQVLKPAILGAIMDHFTSGAPVVAARQAEVAATAARTTDQIREALRRVIDPELGYDIVGLGLVYEIIAGEDGAAAITMTTTTPGCPATNYLMEGARDGALSVSGVEDVEVRLTYEPRWVPEMMSPEAKTHFGIRDGGGW